MREISWLIFIFGCFIASGFATAIGYREKSISKKRILLYVVISCLLLLGVHICTLGFSKYVKDISFLNQKSYSTTFGEVDRIDRARGKGSWGEQTLYLKGKEKHNIGRYDMSGIRKGDIVYIKYLPTSRFALEINK